MVAPTNVRFPGEVDERLSAFAREARMGKSTAAVLAVDEWLTMQRHPGIVFVRSGTERRAALADGPQVWTVAEAWLQHDPTERTADAVADAIGLTPRQVEAALGYWAEHRDEIDEQVRLEHAAADAALAAWERRQELRGLRA